MLELAVAITRKREFRIHPLGFYFLRDHSPPTERSTNRVHVWLPNGPSRPENDRHIHAFDQESLVLAGTLQNELFQFQESSNGTTTEFRVTYRSFQSKLHPTGRRGHLKLSASFTTSPGFRYQLNAGVVHRAIAIDRPCVSVLTTRHRDIPIFSYGMSVEEQPFMRRVVTDTEASSIGHVLEAILNDNAIAYGNHREDR